MTDNEDAPAEGDSDAKGSDGAEEAASRVAPAPSTKAEPSRWRRLHRLSGTVVLGGFLVAHLASNASALGGEASHERVAGAIARFSLMPVVELVFIVVPLAFHAAYGLYLLRRGGSEEELGASELERFGGRRLWLLQRITASFLLVFVLFHVWELRVQRLLFGLSPDALYTTLTARLSWTWAGVPWIALGYLLGVLAAAAHLSNGVFAATAAWKIALDPSGRRRMRLATTGLGLVLFLVGGATVIGLATGTRLLPGADDDSAAPSAPCGSAVPAPTPPFQLRTPSP